jgi:hypothetical protein
MRRRSPPIRLRKIGLVLAAALLTLALGIVPATADRGVAGSWTVLIPDAFPNFIFTWRIAADGSYDEDGRESATGRPIQPTLHGRWSVEGERLILRQTDISYVFDGILSGMSYAGLLYLEGRPVSRFCAVKGETAPKRCSAGEKNAPLISDARGNATHGVLDDVVVDLEPCVSKEARERRLGNRRFRRFPDVAKTVQGTM